MCGFAGILEGGRALRLGPDRIGRMCDSMIHRGPDDRGTFEDGPAHLGFRRLSIIDVAGGHQPMRLGADGPVLVYNGEIYNFVELRAELEALGHAFATGSDTEVLLHAWAQWGLDAPPKLRGMFAFAVWEPALARLVLVRDRLGIKPLHFAHVQDAIVFGSELKAVMASGLVGGDVDLQALDDFFAYGYVRAPRTIFASVQKLRPGHMLVVQREPGDHRLRIDERTWWRVPDGSETLAIGREEAKEELRRLLGDAVRMRLVADVPLGAFLSGGIDSSTVVAMMARLGDRPVETFSIGFDDAGYDETEVARAVATRFGTHHHEQVVRPDAIAVLPEIVRAHDEPFGDPSAIPTWYLAKMTREHVTVALSGDGGDELFAGYVRYAHLQRELARRRVVPDRLLRLVSRAARFVPRESRRRGWIERLALPPEQHYSRFRANFPEPMRRALFTPELAARIDMTETTRVFSATASSHTDPVARMQAADLGWYLPDDILTKVDRMTMAHSLEARVPLLDHRVVEFVTRLPTSFKLSDGRTKAILRDLFPEALPPRVLQRGKQGFSLPLPRWLAGELRPFVEETIASDTYARSEWFEPGYVRRLWDLHRSGARDLSWAIWQLLVFRVWNETTRIELGG